MNSCVSFLIKLAAVQAGNRALIRVTIDNSGRQTDERPQNIVFWNPLKIQYIVDYRLYKVDIPVVKNILPLCNKAKNKNDE